MCQNTYLYSDTIKGTNVNLLQSCIIFVVWRMKTNLQEVSKEKISHTKRSGFFWTSGQGPKASFCMLKIVYQFFVKWLVTLKCHHWNQYQCTFSFSKSAPKSREPQKCVQTKPGVNTLVSDIKCVLLEFVCNVISQKCSLICPLLCCCFLFSAFQLRQSWSSLVIPAQTLTTTQRPY